MNQRFGSLRSVAIAIGAAVIVLGTGAPVSHAATTKPADEPPRVQTADRAGDHWHVAYGVFVCDRYLPPIVSANDPVGVHTHGDGIIHVHPFFAAAAGKNAVLGKFFTTVDMAMTAKELRLPGGKTWKDGDACAAKPGHLRVLAFPDVAVSTSSSSGATTILASAVSSVVAGDPAKIRLHDRQVLAFVFAPDGVVVPVPPAVETLNDLNDVAPAPLDPATVPNIGPRPKLTYPAVAPDKLTTKDLIVGTGAAIVAGKHPWVRLILGKLSTKQEYGSGGWDKDGPVRLRLFGRGRIQPVGLEQGLSGMKVGGRRLLVTPPKVAWGDQGDGSGIGPNETLVWVVDLAAVTN